jgi:hypothetical protein
MKFRYAVETVTRNGSKETAVEEIEKNEILLGRGTSSDILLLGRLVSLNHALLSLVDSSLFIQDTDSLSGVSVNDTLVTKVELAEGDRVRIGRYTFIVTRDDGEWGFLQQRIEEDSEEDTDEILAGQEKKLRFQSYLPSFTVLSGIISLLVIVFFFAAPLSGTNKRSWDSGPISNAHKMIENDCAQCHAAAFTRVRDSECMACHSMSEHAPSYMGLTEKHPQLNYRCASCHMEHNGDVGIIAKNTNLCTECHGALDSLLPKSGTPQVVSLAEHPEFRVTISQDEAGMPKKIRLDSEALEDATQLKLNHKIHLEPEIAGKDGLVTLQCADCHKFSNDLHDIEAINFESHCADCHTLEFDERLPGKSVPHGSPDVVYNYLYAQYAKLFLEKEGEEDPDAASRRRRKPGQTVKRGPEIEFSRSSVKEQARNTENALFNRTACHLCHMISENNEAEIGGSNYTVISPNIPSKWMPASTFDHGAHQEVACESCHVGVRESELTTDVLLPGKENCYQCHAEERTAGRVVSECVTCHSFHDPLILDEDSKRDIERILMSFEQTTGKAQS